MNDNVLYYSIGALLYCPANKITIADSIINETFGSKFSLALCLEDTINDNFVLEAEQDLINSVKRIYKSYQTKPFFLPHIFVRVRNHTQIIKLTKLFGESINIITGYIVPKFSVENAKDYIQSMIKANESLSKKLYMMPIYESSSIIDPRTRLDLLYYLKDELSQIEDLVLNIRVGGNDLCHIFGFRRHFDESIHRIKPISNIFSDIVTVYGLDYIISGPVWEYYSGDNWKPGLRNEISDDKLCGFIGKTVIHPKQIEVVNQAYQITKSDYNDALTILNWDQNSSAYVSGNHTKERMNEYKTHSKWARKTLLLAEYYGIK